VASLSLVLDVLLGVRAEPYGFGSDPEPLGPKLSESRRNIPDELTPPSRSDPGQDSRKPHPRVNIPRHFFGVPGR
jgi:hypothetical protein